jgi:hypothetical protein
MPDALLTPQHITDLLILAFFANEAVRWRVARPPSTANDGTTMVFRGCYAIAVLALINPIPSPDMAAPQIAWMCVFAAACGLGALFAATLALKRGAPGGSDWRHTDGRGNVVFWIGTTAASGNVIAALTVTVMMLAATQVRLASEAAKQQPAAGPADRAAGAVS